MPAPVGTEAEPEGEPGEDVDPKADVERSPAPGNRRRIPECVRPRGIDIAGAWLAAGGLSLASVGLLLLARLDADSTIEQIVGCLVLTGLGQGMFQFTERARLLERRAGRTRG